jgi:outer membrane protein assembly factor BamA
VAGLQLLWDRRDDPVSTRRGTFASVDLSGADETLASDFSYARLFTRASHHLPFGSFQGQPLVWAQSGRIGLARAFRGQSLVGFELLFAGGEYSIRGYDDDSIGPGLFDDVEEQALAVLNQELHVPLWGDLLNGVVFFDAGEVWDDFHELGRDFLTSGGLGLRARTPAGTLRLDVAYPFDRRPGDDEVTVYFGLGNVF